MASLDLQELLRLREQLTTAIADLEVAVYEDDEWSDLLAIGERIVADPAATARDRFVLAVALIEREWQRVDAKPMWHEPAYRRVNELCEAVVDDVPGSELAARAWFAIGIAAEQRWELDEGEALRSCEAYERALEIVPEEPYTLLRLADACREYGDAAGERDSLERLVALGRERGRGAYVIALYRLGRVFRSSGERDRAGQLLEEHRRLLDGSDGVRAVDWQDELRRGTLLQVDVERAPRRRRTVLASPPAPPRLARRRTIDLGAREILSLDWGDLDGNRGEGEAGLDDLLVALVGGDGVGEVVLLERAAARSPEAPSIRFDALESARALAVHQEDPKALLVRHGATASVVVSAEAYPIELRSDLVELPALGGVLLDVAVADFTIDGWVDLVCATRSGLRLLRCDGAPRNPDRPARQSEVRFVDVTGAAGDSFGQARPSWLAIEEFDGNLGVDLIVGGPGQPTLVLCNELRGRFGLVDAREAPLPGDLARAPLVADFDHDGHADLLLPTLPPQVRFGDGHGSFLGEEERPELASWILGTMLLADVDCDGELDVVARRGDGRIGIRHGSLAAAGGRVVELGVGGGSATAPFAVGDLDGDACAELLAVAGGRIDVATLLPDPGSPAARHGVLRLELSAYKDNESAIGTLLEAVWGSDVLRRFATRPVELIGLGERGLPDYLRVTWPNGVCQYVDRAELSRDNDAQAAHSRPYGGPFWIARIAQPHVFEGSCPFLYSWNGERYEFVTDVLGTTPLGLPIDESRFVPPDHDELVRMAPGQCVPVDGEYRFQLTEELRETTYLDRAQLWVVDHPAGTQLHPEERFCFPPFPPPALHVLRKTEPLVRALDQAGRDWTSELAAIDGRHAVPFDRHDARFSGLATAHEIELALPPATRAAARIRLAMTGWFAWTNATANLNIARSGTLAFVPPTLSVPDGAGGWRRIEPPLGFPAGKTKTMVIDVTPWVARDDLRLRVASTLELYWDAIEVALDGEPVDPPVVVTKVEPAMARLSFRGFSAPLVCSGDGTQPSRFDWNVLERWPRFDQHHGLLTRYGDVVELLGAVDDRYVLFSAGDAIDLRFDASALAPPAEGLARTCLLYLDGWAKDGDANTVHSQTVTPLPFHGMSGYPYRDDERFPDDEAHRAWQLEWNTRPGRKLLGLLTAPRPLPERP